MSKKNITHTIVQYFEDPKESKALAEIKRISEQAKNKSSKNLIRIDSKIDEPDINTEVNTYRNRKLFKENNENKFQRRKYQFPTQIYQPNIVNDLRKKANLKRWNLFDDNEEEEKDDFNNKKMKCKNADKHVNFNINKNNKIESIMEVPKKKYDHNTFNPKKQKSTNDYSNNLRKKSSDDTEIITQRIVKYLDDPKDSKALAKIKKLSNQAKIKSSNNLASINPHDDLDNKKTNSNFQRRKFQFPTQVYKPKQNHLTLFQELKMYNDDKNNKKINKPIEKDEDAIGSEDDEDDDSEFNLEKNTDDNDIKPENNKYSNKTYDIVTKKNIVPKENKAQLNSNINYRSNNYSKYKNEPKIVNREKEVKEIKEEQKPEMISNNNKYRKIEAENNKVEPKIEREKYSSNTFNVDEHIKNINRRKDFVNRISYKFDTITEEYKQRNNLTVEKINNKEKIVKNEYGKYNNKNNGKKKLKTYKTEYFWDNIINRLVEKRIYIDENEAKNELNKSNNNYYSNNTFNPFNKYKKDFENKNKENNVTQEKIELDNDNKKQKENVDDKKIVKENTDKRFVYSRKYKYMPHQYSSNTFNVTRNMPNTNVNNGNINNSNKEATYQNETSKPNYRIYQKRQVITTKIEIHENNPKKNKTEITDKEDKNENNKRAPKKEIEVRKKIVISKKINPPVKNYVQEQYPTPEIIAPEKSLKNDGFRYRKIAQPYSSSTNNNTKKKSIRLNMFPGENDIFNDNENELNNNGNKNNIYANYIKNKNPTKNYQRQNRTQNMSELVDDLEKIEQYSINTYLKNDLLEIYGSINEEFKNFKNDVFNKNMNNFEEKMGEFDNKNSIRKKYKYNVKDLCKGKTTTDDIFRKYKKRAINIEKEEES